MIDIVDEILVLNVSDYIRQSTSNEILYAHARGIPIHWLEPYTCKGQECPCGLYWQLGWCFVLRF
jgi:hypothetical protein